MKTYNLDGLIKDWQAVHGAWKEEKSSHRYKSAQILLGWRNRIQAVLDEINKGQARGIAEPK